MTARHVPHPNALKRRLRRGETCIGVTMRFASCEVVEIAAAVGCDFMIIDMEHELFDARDAMALIRTADLCGMTPLARINLGSLHMADALLAAGVQGFSLARIRSAADLDRVAASVLYHPQGGRTVYALGRSGNFGHGTDEEAWMAAANSEILISAIIEEAEAIARLDEILAYPCLDAVDCGTKDLRQSLGMPSAAEVKAIEADVFARAKSAGKATGHSLQGYQPDVDGWRKLIGGPGTMLIATPAGIITSALAAQVAAVRQLAPRSEA